jgi:hypothetical protein
MTEIIFKNPIVLYSLMNAEGLFFKSGNNYHVRWTDDINEAKAYTKVAPARSWATKFAMANPNLPVPQILEIKANFGVVVDETERVVKAKKSIAKADAAREERHARYRKEAAERDLARAQKNLSAINGNTHK